MYCGWEFVSDNMKDKLDDLINDEFYDWQTDLGIESGDLPPELEYKLNCAVDTLLATFNECVTWQADNWSDKINS